MTTKLAATFGFALLALCSTGAAAQAWTQQADAGWSERAGHSTAVFNNKVWVIAGKAGNTYMNDVWSSSDGVTWAQETAAAAFPARHRHTTVVYNNKLWIIGGADGSVVADFMNDVWSSSDGVNWTQETSAAAWTPRVGHTSVVLNGKIWILGGYEGNDISGNDVWSSTDGVNWTKELNLAPWYARSAHASCVFNGRMWLSGGTVIGLSTGIGIPGVWSSADGINWTMNTGGAWSVANMHTMLVHDGRMWIVAGFGSSAYQDHVWSSPDGTSWTQDTTPGFTPRGLHTSASFDSRLWLFGGYDTTFRKDVWTRNEAPTITSTPVTTAIVGQPYSYTVTASGHPAPTFSATNLPGWLTLTGDTLSGMPALGDIGLTATLTVSASNAAGSDDQDFQIDVQGQAPQITSSPVLTATADQAYSYTVVAAGAPAPTMSAAGLPAWLTFNAASGELSGVPSVADIGTHGPITITASNGWGADADQVFSIQVEAPSSVSDGGSGGSDGGCAASRHGLLWPGLLCLLLLALRRRRVAR